MSLHVGLEGVNAHLNQLKRRRPSGGLVTKPMADNSAIIWEISDNRRAPPPKTGTLSFFKNASRKDLHYQ